MSRRCETKQGRKRDQVCEEHRAKSAVENLTERAKARQTVDALLSTSVDNLASPLYVRQTKTPSRRAYKHPSAVSGAPHRGEALQRHRNSGMQLQIHVICA